MMKTKIIIAIGITIGIVAWASIGIVLAHNFSTNPYHDRVTGYSTSYEDEDWWNEMKEHMEERWAVDDEDWWDEMRENIEEQWEELEDGYYHYGGFGRRCWGW